MEQKANVAGISIVTSLSLTLGKLVAGLAMNSASVFAGGIHSGLDLLASVLAYSSASQSKKPADEDHRYGHGKYENVAALAEAIIIIPAVALIIYKAYPGLSSGGEGIGLFELGMAVTGV
ncbi:MAG: cation transporter, partial [Desulfocucumaceae bacterium]